MAATSFALVPATGSACQPETPPPPTTADLAAGAPTANVAAPAVAGLGVVAGTEAHTTVTGPPLTESQDERLRHLDVLARR